MVKRDLVIGTMTEEAEPLLVISKEVSSDDDRRRFTSEDGVADEAILEKDVSEKDVIGGRPGEFGSVEDVLERVVPEETPYCALTRLVKGISVRLVLLWLVTMGCATAELDCSNSC